MSKQYQQPACIFAILLLPFITFAQTAVHDNKLFSFKVHDNLQYEVLEGIPVYKSSTIFLHIKEVNTYTNAAKYADALENMYLDKDDVYTDRDIDTLDGWPIIFMKSEDESSERVFIQKFYLFDDGKTVYSLSISGYETDERIIDEYFNVTKNSFKFKTRKEIRGGLKITLPLFMKEDASVGFWSHLYNKDQTIDVPIRMHHDMNVKYEQEIKDLAKDLKSKKPASFTEESFTIGGAQVTKYALTYVKKLKTTSEEESKQVYVIQHPQGGVVKIFFSGQPKMIAFLGKRMDAVVKSASF